MTIQAAHACSDTFHNIIQENDVRGDIIYRELTERGGMQYRYALHLS
jgi:hypothetical protein